MFPGLYIDGDLIRRLDVGRRNLFSGFVGTGGCVDIR